MPINVNVASHNNLKIPNFYILINRTVFKKVHFEMKTKGNNVWMNLHMLDLAVMSVFRHRAETFPPAHYL